jgi:hypothetical protein
MEMNLSAKKMNDWGTGFNVVVLIYLSCRKQPNARRLF